MLSLGVCISLLFLLVSHSCLVKLAETVIEVLLTLTSHHRQPKLATLESM